MIDDGELRDLDAFALYDGEAQRLDEFLGALQGDEWLEPTLCAGWRRREMLAHLAASEEYNHATIDGTVPALMERATEAGVAGMDAFNQWGVQRLAGHSVDDMLAEWRRASTHTRTRFRELGWDGTLATFVGPYPAGRQALHLAMELAVHADDMGVPVSADQQSLRATWQPRVSRFTLREYERDVRVDVEGDRNRISGAGVEIILDDAGLVAACTARLPAGDPTPQALRDLLRVFA